jgi:hypothetical protein
MFDATTLHPVAVQIRRYRERGLNLTPGQLKFLETYGEDALGNPGRWIPAPIAPGLLHGKFLGSFIPKGTYASNIMRKNRGSKNLNLYIVRCHCDEGEFIAICFTPAKGWDPVLPALVFPGYRSFPDYIGVYRLI